MIVVDLDPKLEGRSDIFWTARCDSCEDVSGEGDILDPPYIIIGIEQRLTDRATAIRRCLSHAQYDPTREHFMEIDFIDVPVLRGLLKSVAEGGDLSGRHDPELGDLGPDDSSSVPA